MAPPPFGSSKSKKGNVTGGVGESDGDGSEGKRESSGRAVCVGADGNTSLEGGCDSDAGGIFDDAEMDDTARAVTAAAVEQGLVLSPGRARPVLASAAAPSPNPLPGSGPGSGSGPGPGSGPAPGNADVDYRGHKQGHGHGQGHGYGHGHGYGQRPGTIPPLLFLPGVAAPASYSAGASRDAAARLAGSSFATAAGFRTKSLPPPPSSSSPLQPQPQSQSQPQPQSQSQSQSQSRPSNPRPPPTPLPPPSRSSQPQPTRPARPGGVGGGHGHGHGYGSSPGTAASSSSSSSTGKPTTVGPDKVQRTPAKFAPAGSGDSAGPRASRVAAASAPAPAPRDSVAWSATAAAVGADKKRPAAVPNTDAAAASTATVAAAAAHHFPLRPDKANVPAGGNCFLAGTAATPPSQTTSTGAAPRIASVAATNNAVAAAAPKPSGSSALSAAGAKPQQQQQPPAPDVLVTTNATTRTAVTPSAAPASASAANASGPGSATAYLPPPALKSPVAARAFPLNCCPDPEIVSTVTAVLDLLQTYGPLTAEQMEFNLPPLKKQTGAGSTHGAPKMEVRASLPGAASSGASAARRSKLRQILDVMVAAGAISIIDDGLTPVDERGSSQDSSDSNQNMGTAINPQPSQSQSQPQSQSQSQSQSPSSGPGGAVVASSVPPAPLLNRRRRYAFLRGKPRADVIHPSRLLGQIRDANEEIRRARERIEFLRQELRIITSDDDNVLVEEEEAAGNGGGVVVAMGVHEVTSGGTTTAVAGARAGNLPSADVNANADAATTVRASPSDGPSWRWNMKGRGKLRTTAQLTESARSVLHSILVRYPEVAYDPVYAAALRNAGVDAAAADKDRELTYHAATGDVRRAATGMMGGGGAPLAPMSAAAIVEGGGGGGGGSKRKSSSGGGGPSHTRTPSSTTATGKKKRKKDGGGGNESKRAKKRTGEAGKHHREETGKLLQTQQASKESSGFTRAELDSKMLQNTEEAVIVVVGGVQRTTI